MGRRALSIFSYEEKHFAELWVAVSYFASEAVVQWCSAKVGVLQKAFLEPLPKNIWKATVNDVF